MENPFPHTLVLGHRGAPQEAPENTLASFDLAMTAGADGVELDVRAAGDGTLVVIHDATLDRTTDRTGSVAALTAAELPEARSGGEAIPTLAQAAEWAVRHGAWLNVEIKEAGIEGAVLETLGAAGPLDRVFISSFHAPTLQAIGRLDPGVRRFLLTTSWDAEAHAALTEADAHGVCLGVDGADDVALDVLRREGLPVVVWTVDDAHRIRELIDAGAAAIITNRPAVGAALVKSAATATGGRTTPTRSAP